MTTQAEKEAIISQRPPECEKLPELAEEILDILGDASMENNAIAYNRDGFQYMIFFSENGGMIICASKILESETAIKHENILNQFNLRSRYGSCSICKYSDLNLFFYRGEIVKEDIFEAGDLVNLLNHVENETALEYEVLNRL